MASIISSLEHLLASVLDIFRSVFNTILSALESVTAIFMNLVQSIFDLMSSLFGFILGNIVIIGILVAAFVGYSAYKQKNQGGGTTAGKKRA